MALPEVGLDEPVATVMTSGLVTVAPQASAHQAVLTMAHHGVRHLVVVDADGALAGILSHDEIFGMQRAGVDEVSDFIQAARDRAGLQAAAGADPACSPVRCSPRGSTRRRSPTSSPR